MVDRRSFLELAALSCCGVGLAKAAERLVQGTALGDGWRTFEVTTRVEVLQPSGVTRVWLPRPLLRETPFQVTVSNVVQCERGRTHVIAEDAYSPAW